MSDVDKEGLDENTPDTPPSGNRAFETPTHTQAERRQRIAPRHSIQETELRQVFNLKHVPELCGEIGQHEKDGVGDDDATVDLDQARVLVAGPAVQRKWNRLHQPPNVIRPHLDADDDKEQVLSNN